MHALSFRNMIFILLISALSCTSEVQDCELSSCDCILKQNKQMCICNTFYGSVDKYLLLQLQDNNVENKISGVVLDDSQTITTFWNYVDHAIVIRVSTSAS